MSALAFDIIAHAWVAFAPTQQRAAGSCHILTKYSLQSTTVPSYTTYFSTNTIDGCLKQLQEPSRNHSLHLAMAATLFNRRCLLVWLFILLSYHQFVPIDFSVATHWRGSQVLHVGLKICLSWKHCTSHTSLVISLEEKPIVDIITCSVIGKNPAGKNVITCFIILNSSNAAHYICICSHRLGSQYYCHQSKSSACICPMGECTWRRSCGRYTDIG